MDTDTVKRLAEILDLHGLTRVSVAEGNLNIVLEKCKGGAEQAAPQARQSGTEGNAFPEPPLNETLIKSPIVGVFYSAPQPGSPPFTSIGSTVRKGDVLCVIEAMKVLNEITSEYDGEITDVCIRNGEVAEYGQVLFKLAAGTQ